MKSKTLFILIIGIFCITILTYCVGSEGNETKHLFREKSPYGGGYRVSAYCPDGYGIPGGNANIDFSIYSDTKKTRITRFVLSVYSGGKKPDEDNYNIEWHEDYVIITVFDEGTRDVENGMLD